MDHRKTLSAEIIFSSLMLSLFHISEVIEHAKSVKQVNLEDLSIKEANEACLFILKSMPMPETSFVFLEMLINPFSSTISFV